MTQGRSVLSEEELAVVNSRLNEIVRESGWARTVAIGDLLVERVFNGVANAVEAPREACKHPSIRKLAQRPDCPLRKTALAQAIGVYSVIQKEPNLRQLAGITPAHVALLVSYPSEKRREILARAEAENWSVRTLSRNTKEIASASTPTVKTGRRASSRQALTFFEASLKAAESGLRLLWRHEEMDRDAATEILKTVRSLATILTDSGELVSRMRRTSDIQHLGSSRNHEEAAEVPRLVNSDGTRGPRPAAARLPAAMSGRTASLGK